MPVVSVVIPTYNRAHVLDRAIDSALSQTLADIEVIVVDDGSTDATEQVIETFDDERLVFVEHNRNRGGSAARNTGIDHATGSYIAFLDSDDSWEPTKLRRQVSLLKRRSSDWVAAYCDFRQTRDNPLVEAIDHLTRRPTGFEGGEELIGKILLRRFAAGGASTLLVERDVLTELDGFDASFQRHQDLEFLIRLLQVGKLGYVDETLVTKHDTGTPSADVAAEAGQRFRETFSDLIAERGYQERVEAVQRFMLGKHHLRDGDIRTGLRAVLTGDCPHYRDALGAGIALWTGLTH